MTDTETPKLTLPNGLSGSRCRDLRALVSRVTGLDSASEQLPWLAPALLFADEIVQSRLAMPTPGPDDVLVQDYQAIHYDRPCPQDRALTVTAAKPTASPEYHFTLAEPDRAICVRMETALRLVAAADIGTARPASMRAAAMKDTVCGAELALTQDQVNAYLEVSGDRNPIHHDPAATRAMGLRAPVVPGLLLVSLVQPQCLRAAANHTLSDLKARFLSPLCIGDAFRICVQRRGEAAGLTRLRAYVLSQSDSAIAIADLSFSQG